MDLETISDRARSWRAARRQERQCRTALRDAVRQGDRAGLSNVDMANAAEVHRNTISSFLAPLRETQLSA